MDQPRALRELLGRRLDWEAAHIGFSRAVADFPPELRGTVPAGCVHSAWHLLEHMRLAQADILDFCVNPGYVEPASMAEYWPRADVPASEAAWDASIARHEEDERSLRRLALDEHVDLFEPIPWGEGQTIARELLLVADHDAYHLGQLIALRRSLGCWRE